MIESLDVMLWGMKVGTLVSIREGYGNKVCFYFDRAFVSGGYDIQDSCADLGGS